MLCPYTDEYVWGVCILPKVPLPLYATLSPNFSRMAPDPQKIRKPLVRETFEGIWFSYMQLLLIMPIANIMA